MSPATSRARPEKLAALAGILVFLVGVLVLVGWVLHVSVVTSIVPGWSSMAPLSALALVLSGATLWGIAATTSPPHGSARHRLLQAGAYAVAFVTVLKLCDYLFGWNLGLDRLGLRELPGVGIMYTPTYMAPMTAVGFFLVGCALWLATRERVSALFQVVTLLAGFVGWLGCSRYLYGGDALLLFVPMAVHTAAALVILSAGILCTRTDAGLMALLTSDGSGGILARRLVVGVLAIPTLLAWLQVLGQRAGWFGLEGGMALFALADVLILGALVWTSAALVDVADTRRAETSRALSESETRFRAMADGAPVMLWMAGTDKGCVFCNTRWLEFTGRSVEQELGNGWTEGVHPSDLDQCFRTYSQAFDERRAFVMEHRLRRHDGVYRHVLDHGTPRFDTNGTFVGYIGSTVDVTEVRRAQQRLELAMEATPTAMIMMNQDGRIVFLNTQAERVFGYARAELLGRSMDVLVPDLTRPAPADVQRDYVVAATGRWMGADREVRGRRKDGGEVLIEVGLSPIHSVEGIDTLASIIDITARRELELRAAQQRDQLAHLSRVAMLGELSGSIAHELNQPLAAILSNAQAALRFLATDAVNIDEVRSILRDIAEDDARAGEVIKRLRALLRNDEVQFRSIDANDVVLDVLRLMGYDLQHRKVSVSTELAAGLPALEGDWVQLQQVLINLILNACEAMDDAPKDRRLTIRTGPMAAGEVEVSVIDRGTGIPPEDLERIFNPFVSTKREGMGLGLALCRTIVGAHGGRLWATNNADRGATIHFTVPTANGAAASATGARAPAPR